VGQRITKGFVTLELTDSVLLAKIFNAYGNVAHGLHYICECSLHTSKVHKTSEEEYNNHQRTNDYQWSYPIGFA
jgi:hypothetical protein